MFDHCVQGVSKVSVKYFNFIKVADSRSAIAVKIYRCFSKKKWRDQIFQEQLFSQEHFPTAVHLKSIENA